MKHTLFIAVAAAVIAGVLLLALLFARPTTVSEPAEDAEAPGLATGCTTDADCIRTGCSSQLCVHVSARDTVTTCEFTRAYACRAEDACGCVAGTCAWADNPAYVACLGREGEP